MKMGMGSYPENIGPESNIRSSVSHVACLYADRFFPMSNPAFDPTREIQANSGPGIAIVPIRMIPYIDSNAPWTKETMADKGNSYVNPASQVASMALKPKQPKKKPSASKKPKGPVILETKRESSSLNIDLNGANFDLSAMPFPVCSCTGVARVCYKWGAGGWQSSCCTINISEYPLPMSLTRPRSRVAGRKMSTGAYMKLLLRLVNEGHDLSHPVDLKNHWARHGTNKFVTIK